MILRFIVSCSLWSQLPTGRTRIATGHHPLSGISPFNFHLTRFILPLIHAETDTTHSDFLPYPSSSLAESPQTIVSRIHCDLVLAANDHEDSHRTLHANGGHTRDVITPTSSRSEDAALKRRASPHRYSPRKPRRYLARLDGSRSVNV